MSGRWGGGCRVVSGGGGVSVRGVGMVVVVGALSG